MPDKQDKTLLDREKTKSEKEKAMDIAYTLNHALVCTATDFIDPIVSNHIQKRLGNQNQLKNCWIAELIGDFGAVPVTIGVQRFFPSVMSEIRNLLEPVFGKAFIASAQKEGKNWALRHGYSSDSPECTKRIKKIYQYEIEHLPQALMWTCSSVAINIASQKCLGSTSPVSHIFAGKIGGAALTAALTISGRYLFPHKAEKWDKFVGEKLLLPIEEKTEEILNIEEHNKESWANRIRNPNTQTIQNEQSKKVRNV